LALAGTAAAAATTTGISTSSAASGGTSSATATDGVFRFDNETVVGHVDLDFASLALQFFVDDKGKSCGLKYFVFIVRLIQSQSQAWACSATGREIDADSGGLFVLEVAFQLLLCSFCNFKHE